MKKENTSTVLIGQKTYVRDGWLRQRKYDMFVLGILASLFVTPRWKMIKLKSRGPFYLLAVHIKDGKVLRKSGSIC